jgi:hypothetical protein
MQGSTKNYIEQRRRAPDFLSAVIRGDLFDAYGRADDINLAYMHDWVMFFYNEAPAACFGSVEKMEAWLNPQEESNDG